MGVLEEIRDTKRNLALSSEAVVSAHQNFISNYNSFLSITDQLEKKVKELEVRETAVKIVEEDAFNKSKKLEERERKCAEREQKFEKWEKELLAKEQSWKATEEQMKQNAAKLPIVVTINIGGTKFTISKEKLLQHKGSLFEQILCSNYPQQLPSGEIFIERNPKYFHYVFQYLLDGTHLRISNEIKQVAVENEFAFFQISYAKLTTEVRNVTSSVTTQSIQKDVEPNWDNKEICVSKWLPNQRFQLIYKASRDGFASKHFHRCCDNKGATLSFFQSKEGFIFGGYTPLAWSINTAKPHPDIFIFTLTNPHNIPPTKYSPTPNPAHGIQYVDYLGPVFGGCDIYIAGDAHQNQNSYFNFPQSIADTTGKGDTTFTGSRKFTLKEIEVFSVL